MISGLLGAFFGETLYIRIERDWLTVRDVRRGRELREPPLAAVAKGAKRELVAVGKDAAALRGDAAVDVVNPFAHPRSPLSDFTLAEALLEAMMRKLRGNRWYAPAQVIVMHLPAKLEGGITQIEARALKELGIGAGASRSIVWDGPALSDEQVLRQKFPTTGEILDQTR